MCLNALFIVLLALHKQGEDNQLKWMNIETTSTVALKK